MLDKIAGAWWSEIRMLWRAKLQLYFSFCKTSNYAFDKYSFNFINSHVHLLALPNGYLVFDMIM